MPSGGFKFRTDENHKQIADVFRAFGAKVITLHHAGHGVPDLLVLAKDGAAYFVEVKTRNGKLKAEQAKFITAVQSSVIVRSVEEVERFFKDFKSLRAESVEEAQKVLTNQLLSGNEKFKS